MKNKNYFGQEAEKSVAAYVRCADHKKREEIYVIKIMPVFRKLIENIIFRYDFLKLSNSYVELHHEVMAHLYLNIDKFNPDLGYKAYSYFGTAAKRYLQQKSITKTFESKNTEDLFIQVNDEIKDNTAKYKDFEDKQVEENNREFISILIKNFKDKSSKDKNEKKIIEAIVFLLERYEGVNINNKKHFYVLVREYTGLDTKIITKIMNKNILKLYAEIRKKYINNEM